MYDVRLYISKPASMKYVSHLDMFRLMQRAVRRADIPLWYTEGFNPHPYISFLMALPLGVESAAEPCDIRIVNETEPGEVMDRLNAVMPGDFRIVKAVRPMNKPTEIMYSGYEFRFSAADVSPAELTDALDSGALVCEKTGKQGRKKVTREISVSEHVAEYRAESDGDETVLTAVVSAGTGFNLSPANLLDGISRFLGRPVSADRIIRTGFMCGGFAPFE